MEEDIQKKTYEEVAALKDLFLRRLMDDKIKAAAIVRLNENNEALQRQLDERASILQEGYSSHNAEGLEVYVRSVFIVYIYRPTIFPKICFFSSSYR